MLLQKDMPKKGTKLESQYSIKSLRDIVESVLQGCIALNSSEMLNGSCLSMCCISKILTISLYRVKPHLTMRMSTAFGFVSANLWYLSFDKHSSRTLS